MGGAGKVGGGRSPRRRRRRPFRLGVDLEKDKRARGVLLWVVRAMPCRGVPVTRDAGICSSWPRPTVGGRRGRALLLSRGASVSAERESVGWEAASQNKADGRRLRWMGNARGRRGGDVWNSESLVRKKCNSHFPIN